jgi:tRNA(Ile)-lysidine synthase
MTSRNIRHKKLSKFGRQLLSEWRKLKLPTSDETIVVAVSGGADSTALLLAIDELIKAGKLSVKMVVAHLDHRLRSSSKTDAKWVAEVATRLGYTPTIGRANVRAIAEARADNLEQAARRARYEFLEKAASRRKAHFVLTAHTMDDQAETVLLSLMRGGAAGGLSGMGSLRPLSRGSMIGLVRPLLWARRRETEEYCTFRKMPFLSDEMNDDDTFARVRVRKQLLPLMRSFNNKIVEALSRTAILLHEDSSVLAKDAGDLLSRATMPGADPTNRGKSAVLPVSVNSLVDAPPALRRRALRQWLLAARGDTRRLEMVHLLAVERLLEGVSGGRTVELPSGARVVRRQGRLEFEAEND